MDKNYFITITGLNYYFGTKPFKIGKFVKLIKEPDNEHDSEAIMAYLPHIDTIGYVANSSNTVYDGTISAGRLYDKIDNYAYAKVLFVTHSSVIAVVLSPDEVEGDDGEDVKPEQKEQPQTKPKTKRKSSTVKMDFQG